MYWVILIPGFGFITILSYLFLEFVYLTKTEHGRLIDRIGEKKTDDMINKLNNYIGSKGEKYKSHYHTILNWLTMDNKDDPRKLSYDIEARANRERLKAEGKL